MAFNLLDNEISGDLGIYAPISPSFGEFIISKDDEKVSVIGLKCQPGLQSEIIRSPKKYADIYVSHIPPIGCLDLSVRFGIDHIGSEKLLSAIKRHSPKLVICGHSLIWGGNIAKIGKTAVINVSSNDNREAIGNYALIDTSNWSIELKTTQRKLMFAIRGTNALRRRCLDSKNVELEKFGWLFYNGRVELPEFLDHIEKFDIDTTSVRERLKSIGWKKPKIKRPITINPYNQAFMDVETGLAQGEEPGKLWLVGIGFNGKITQFTFPTEKKAF